MAEISTETSNRICVHMNDDHGVSVHGMVASLDDSNGTIKNAKMTGISLRECTLSYVICRGDLCEMKIARYPFQPPLTSVAESRARLVEIHSKVLSPNFRWLVSDPLTFGVLLTMVCLSVATFAGVQEVETYIGNHWQGVSSTLAKVFGSTNALARFAIGSFWFGIIVHALEGSYCAYHAVLTLKLKSTIAIQWFVIVTMIGYPVAHKFTTFVSVHRALEGKTKK